MHEYKPQLTTKINDPLGQLLAAMLVSQHNNESSAPIIGCRVIGLLWNFVVLDGKDYCVSGSFDAASDDIYKIYSILMAIRTQIEVKIAGLP